MKQRAEQINVFRWQTAESGFEMWGYQLCGENRPVTKVLCNILVRFNFLNKHETITSEAWWPRSEQLSPVSGQEQWRQQRPESLLNGGKRSWEVFFWENSCHVKNRMIGLNHAGYCAVRGGILLICSLFILKTRPECNIYPPISVITPHLTAETGCTGGFPH